MFQLCVFCMLPAIQFNNEFCFMAVEIQDVRTQRVLTTKLEVQKLTISKQRPKQLLCIC